MPETLSVSYTALDEASIGRINERADGSRAKRLTRRSERVTSGSASLRLRYRGSMIRT